MYRVKIFDLPSVTPNEDAEKLINKWLEKHPHLEYANLAISGEDQNGKVKYALTYKLKNLEQ